MKITKTWARKMLSATNKVIKGYKKSIKYIECPFCETVLKISGKSFKCEICPWVVFLGYKCHVGHDDSKYNDIALDDFYTATPIPERLPRLYGWRKRLTNIIERGK